MWLRCCFPGGITVAMIDRARPAAYIRTERHDDDLDRQRAAATADAAQRGWPPPMVYLEDNADLAAGHAPALAALAAAIEAGRHDALLITAAAAVTVVHGMGVLLRCTRHGVIVGFLVPPSAAQTPVMTPPRAAPVLPPLSLRRRRLGLVGRVTHTVTAGEKLLG